MNYEYTAVGDMIVFLTCIVLLAGLKSTYTQKTRRYTYVIAALINLIIICFVSIIFNYYFLQNVTVENTTLVYILHNTLYTGLIVEFVLFLFYIFDLINYNQRWLTILVIALTVIFCLLELTSDYTHIGFYIENGVVQDSSLTNIYFIWYVLYLFIMGIVIITKNRVIINKIYWAIAASFGVSLFIIISQYLYDTQSFTTLSYFMPVLMVVILFHCNSYNSSFGAIGRAALQGCMNSLIEGKKDFVFVRVVIPHFAMIENDPQTSEDFKAFVRAVNYKDYLFRYSEDCFVMIFNKNAKWDKIEGIFEKLHDKYQMSHRIIIVKANEYCHSLDDYMNLCKTVYADSVYKVTENDLIKFNKMNIIRMQLEDIETKGDLNDERVKVYCQPILNIETKTFTTAESLMRLELPEVGFIYPDVFIPIAEADGRIHALTMVILNKVCQFIQENQEIERISVNFSMYEIVMPDFYEDILSVVTKYSFDKSKLGFEITESIEADDYSLIKEILTKFKSLGIKIYLDDFGTGYSNIEHIIKLPIDIIKFDRSLVVSSGRDKDSNCLVESLSNVFNIIGYSLLYEGIEDESDQNRCISMKAEYLQGYRYSKPIPIEQLTGFINLNFEEEL